MNKDLASRHWEETRLSETKNLTHWQLTI